MKVKLKMNKKHKLIRWVSFERGKKWDLASLLSGKDGNNLEKDELEEIAGEGEDNAENDLHQSPFLLVLFVETTVQEPETSPTE